ncbi:MAG: N-6 DNA methylase, partial [Bacteroidales bacterium]|nr:N-6 DNA methylase [Bacteroidales bacterium]
MILKNYLKKIADTTARGDAREESYYEYLSSFFKNIAQKFGKKKIDVTTLPKKTEAGNPDFRIWDGKQHIVGYIEAKSPNTNLDIIETSGQLKRYRDTFPNLILTNFYEFRLYRDGELIERVSIGRPFIAKKLKTIPPLEKEKEFTGLLEKFFSFSLPKSYTASGLAVELAKRTRFLKDEVIFEELKEEKEGKGDIIGFYEAFKKYLITGLTEKSFADLYSQTITYGLFAARTRADGEFNRTLAFNHIPHTIGILRDVFRFISLGNLPKQMEVIIDDISEVLNVADIKKILHQYYKEGKGKDPIIHFYETFLSKYDPEIRERRGVYYTPEPVVSYIVRSVHKLLKTHFGLRDGMASKEVTLLDPAGGTLTFPAEAIKQAVEEYTKKYGKGGKNNLIKNQILRNFYAFELMMAPYAIGHLKISFILEELGYRLQEDERFKLYLTNTLEMEDIEQISIPGLSSLSEESHLAGKVKKQKPILLILGNPPYSGISSNKNEWTERLLKEDIDGAQSYYTVDDKPLGEKKLWLQDDYVKFLRFAQWKIQKAGKGIVGMITNHSYLDNPTFRGMRQSLMKTFNEIYILDLHGNSLKKETTPDGG